LFLNICSEYLLGTLHINYCNNALLGEEELVKHSVGYRSRTRKLLRKGIRERGVTPLSRVIYPYKEGEKVVIDIDPSMHKGMPHRRYHGKIGEIVGRRGRAYIIKVYLGNKEKTLIIRPQHIKPLIT